ncbi:MAG: lipoyl synthase, partial [Deltaproteobacteria bacterium]|nr:lipoyl synthase [Deltaproteobacteria bacterium]
MEKAPHRRSALRKPPWLKRKIPSGAVYQKVRNTLKGGCLHTVCEEALCPNLGECFMSGTATFMILGDRCTRNCRFCAVRQGPLGPPDPGEAERVARAVEDLGLEYVVITSVTRDDVPDGGAGVFADTIRAIRNRKPGVKIEVLIPDFQGDWEALRSVVEAGPDVLNHNLETVPRLYPSVRPQAVYQRSLDLLRVSRELDGNLPTKSGLMLGLGESAHELKETLRDLLDSGCRMLTLGQYLRPSKEHLPIDRYVPPEEFEEWRLTALDMGFEEVAAGPLVRSSYHAKDLYYASLHFPS